MREKPKTGECYRHFKGNVYRIITIAKHTETMEEMVIYTRADIEDVSYARPLDMFLSEVDADKYPDVKDKYRFTLVTDDKERSAEEDDFVLDPLLEAFLDADSYEEKVDCFLAMRNKADEFMLRTVAISLDFELSKDDVEEQYEELLSALRTMKRFECNRLRPNK